MSSATIAELVRTTTARILASSLETAPPEEAIVLAVLASVINRPAPSLEQQLRDAEIDACRASDRLTIARRAWMSVETTDEETWRVWSTPILRAYLRAVMTYREARTRVRELQYDAAFASRRERVA